VICARLFLFIPAPLALGAIPVLQELRAAISAATAVVAEIEVRFKSGDSADALIAKLGSLVAVLARHPADTIPAELQSEIAQLLVRIQETVGVGEDWLERTGPELASHHCRQRLQRAYGVT